MAAVLKRNVVIGIDYGTHSTKVVVRERNAEIGEVLQFDRSCKGYPANAAPSAIREIGGRLFFGSEALYGERGINYGSLKAKLLKSSGDNEWNDRIDVLASAYISWAIGEIIASDPRLASDRKIIQVSAPMSHEGDAALEKRYLRVVHAAYKFALEHGRLEQGVSLKHVESVFSNNLALPVPDRGERFFQLGPETVAPMVSLQMNPLSNTGIYLIIDMGAATTEMAVCGFNEVGGTNILLGYADSTFNQGGDRLDKIDQMPVGPSQKRMEEFLADFDKQALKTWFTGFQKDKQNLRAASKWNNLNIFLTGGATYRSEVLKYINEKLKPRPVWIDKEHRKLVHRHIPETIKTFNGSDEDFSLFAVANGLSIQRASWPKFAYSSEIEPLKGNQPVVKDVIPSYLETF